MFCKKGVLKNFAKFIEKHLCQSFRLVAASDVSSNNTLTKIIGVNSNLSMEGVWGTLSAVAHFNL